MKFNEVEFRKLSKEERYSYSGCESGDSVIFNLFNEENFSVDLISGRLSDLIGEDKSYRFDLILNGLEESFDYASDFFKTFEEVKKFGDQVKEKLIEVFSHYDGLDFEDFKDVLDEVALNLGLEIR